jgi:tetratricopeptide (TPR) repeat protein
MEFRQREDPMISMARLVGAFFLVRFLIMPVLADEAAHNYERGHAALNDAWDFEAQSIRMGYSANSKLKYQEQAVAAYHNALRLFTAAAAEDPANYKAYSMSGLVLRRLGRYEEAMADYRKALDVNPKDFRTLEYNGEALVDVGQLKEAQQVYYKLMNENVALAADLLAYMKMWLAKHNPSTQVAVSGDEFSATQLWLDERIPITNQQSTQNDSSMPWK